MWTVGLVILAPRAKTITLRLSAQPTDSEIEDLMAREGAITAHVSHPAGR